MEESWPSKLDFKSHAPWNEMYQVILAHKNGMHYEQSIHHDFFPRWVDLPSLMGRAVSRHFSKIKAIWLAFDSLFYFTTEHLILRKKGEKGSKYPFEKILGSGVSYIKGRYYHPLCPQYSTGTSWFYLTFCAIKLACFFWKKMTLRW